MYTTDSGAAFMWDQNLRSGLIGWHHLSQIWIGYCPLSGPELYPPGLGHLFGMYVTKGPPRFSSYAIIDNQGPTPAWGSVARLQPWVWSHPAQNHGLCSLINRNRASLLYTTSTPGEYSFLMW